MVFVYYNVDKTIYCDGYSMYVISDKVIKEQAKEVYGCLLRKPNAKHKITHAFTDITGQRTEKINRFSKCYQTTDNHYNIVMQKNKSVLNKWTQRLIKWLALGPSQMTDEVFAYDSMPDNDDELTSVQTYLRYKMIDTVFTGRFGNYRSFTEYGDEESILDNEDTKDDKDKIGEDLRKLLQVEQNREKIKRFQYNIMDEVSASSLQTDIFDEQTEIDKKGDDIKTLEVNDFKTSVAIDNVDELNEPATNTGLMNDMEFGVMVKRIQDLQLSQEMTKSLIMLHSIRFLEFGNYTIKDDKAILNKPCGNAYGDYLTNRLAFDNNTRKFRFERINLLP